jgi:hypothetical protein
MPGLIEPPEYNDDKASDVIPPYNVINDIDNHSITNVFCFGAFADKFTVLYKTTAPASSLSYHLMVTSVSL